MKGERDERRQRHLSSLCESFGKDNANQLWLAGAQERNAVCWRKSARRKRQWLLTARALADVGFDGRSFSLLDLIASTCRHGKLVALPCKALARPEGLYGQGWEVETMHSVIKRRFGDRICSRSVRLQRREACIKGLVYDVHPLATRHLCDRTNSGLWHNFWLKRRRGNLT